MKMLEDFGKGTSEFFEYAGGVTMLGGEAIGFIAKLRIRILETLNQAYFLGLQSLIIVLLTSLFTGMVFSLESAQQAVQYGVGSLLGGVVTYTAVREQRAAAVSRIECGVPHCGVNMSAYDDFRLLCGQTLHDETVDAAHEDRRIVQLAALRQHGLVVQHVRQVGKRRLTGSVPQALDQ